MTTSRLTTHRNTSSKKITNSPFSAGKSLAQKFGVKYIETSPGEKIQKIRSFKEWRGARNGGY